MTEQANTTTIERHYADDRTQSGGSPSTILPQGYLDIQGEVTAKRQVASPALVSPAALLHDVYFERAMTALGPSLVEGNAGLAMVPDEFILPFAHQKGALRRQPAVSPRRERHAAVIALLEKWAADDRGDDEDAWRRLKKRIEESRTSTRKRFSD